MDEGGDSGSAGLGRAVARERREVRAEGGLYVCERAWDCVGV
jgi:hypothetical protein